MPVLCDPETTVRKASRNSCSKRVANPVRKLLGGEDIYVSFFMLFPTRSFENIGPSYFALVPDFRRRIGRDLVGTSDSPLVPEPRRNWLRGSVAKKNTRAIIPGCQQTIPSTSTGLFDLGG